MALVYRYIRFSTPQQLHGDSLRRQTEVTEAFCREGNHTLADLTLRDPGVSAFRGRNAASGDLARFREAIAIGRVKPGAILAVENLDRLSRDQVTNALQLLLSIITAGVSVYTTMDRKLYSIESINKNPMDLMFSILVMMRGHEESVTKSLRTSANWAQKRKAAAEKREPITPNCPTWMMLDQEAGVFKLIPERAKLVKQICRWTCEGRGIMHITRRLNREGVPTWSRKGTELWEHSTIRLMTTSRALLGEYQPYALVDGRWKAAGEPIKNFYPAVLSESEYYQMQGTITRLRGDRTTRHGPALHNLFGSLIQDPDGRRYHVNHISRDNRPGRKNQPRQHLQIAEAKKAGESILSFPYPPFEAAFLHWVTEVADTYDHSQEATEASRLEELQETFNEIITKLEKVKAAMLEAGGDVDTFVQMVPVLEAQKRQAGEELTAAKARQQGQAVGRGDVPGLVKKLAEVQGDERLEVRSKVKATIASLVRSITLHVRVESVVRLAVAHVRLTNGCHRFLAVRTERCQPELTFSDVDQWEAWNGQDDEWASGYANTLAEAMIGAKTVDGMTKAWTQTLDHYQMFTPVFPEIGHRQVMVGR